MNMASLIEEKANPNIPTLTRGDTVRVSTRVIEGDKEQISTALQHINQVKGARIPEVHQMKCEVCDRPGCSLAGRKIAMSG